MGFTLSNLFWAIVGLSMIVGMIMYFIHDYNKHIK